MFCFAGPRIFIIFWLLVHTRQTNIARCSAALVYMALGLVVNVVLFLELLQVSRYRNELCEEANCLLGWGLSGRLGPEDGLDWCCWGGGKSLFQLSVALVSFAATTFILVGFIWFRNYKVHSSSAFYEPISVDFASLRYRLLGHTIHRSF